MKYLLDTSCFIWILLDEREKVPVKTQNIIETSDELYLSAASIWEIAIKSSIGKLGFKQNIQKWIPEMVLKGGFKQLPITHRHTLAVASLPHHHKDPFDRLLIAQARVENMTLLTPDVVIKKYKVKVAW